MGAAIVGTDPVSDLLGTEQAGRRDNGALAMHPFGVDRVQPGTRDRQEARHDAHTLPLLLDVAGVIPDPGADSFTAMPGGVVPDQHPHPPAGFLQPRAAP